MRRFQSRSQSTRYACPVKRAQGRFRWTRVMTLFDRDRRGLRFLDMTLFTPAPILYPNRH